MSEPDLGRVRKLLIEANDELRQSQELAEQVDLHAAAAKRRIAEARIELEQIAATAAKLDGQRPNGKGQQK